MFKESSPRTVYLKEYRPPPWTIDTADLLFDLREQGTRVISRLTLERNPAYPGEARELLLHGEELTPVWLRLDGSELHGDRYRIDEEGLTLFDPPDRFVLESEVEIAPETNTRLEGLYRSGGMFCTQCEAEGFRRITWYLDRPDVMARFNVRIEADRQKYPVLLSNGNPEETGELPEGRHYAVWDDPFPKPSYLFALVAGDLKHVEERFTTLSGREVRLRIHVEPENIDRCGHAMRSLVHAMRWDEERFGREYDLDVFNIVAVNDFNMGAMENKGLNIFNSKYVLARPDTATDADYQGIEAVVAHEYFHNWTGNRITCRDWFQLSLKEGFTVYRDQEFSADMGSRGVKRIDDVRLLRAHQFAEDAGPMAHPVRPDHYMEINNFYTVTVYEKGAEVVRMQAELLGPETFRRATDLYFERHDGQAVTTDDFVRCMEDASGRDLTQFKHWYDYAGTPEIDVSGEYDAAARRYTLCLRQRVPDTPGQSDKPPFHIPVRVGLLDSAGNDMKLVREDACADPALIELREPEQRFVFLEVEEAPVPSLLRGFSAPVKLHFDYSDEQLHFLMAHDSDGFNRWDAAQMLAQRMILGMVEAGIEPVTAPADYLETFRRTLESSGEDPALAAEVLQLPSESWLADQMEKMDVEGVHRVREGIKGEVGRKLESLLVEHYKALHEPGIYEITPGAIGRRSLKNLLLEYLMAGGGETAHALCLAQYNEADNMTDTIAALGYIAHSDLPERKAILAEFAERWKDDPLVMDKWFSVQAMSRRDDTLPGIQVLLSHPTFSMENPNKVRSLIGAFAAGNPLRFHAPDGSGYTFLVDKVLELDGINPQIAARLLRNLSRWRRLDAGRQALVRAQLERVSGQPGISRALHEVATRLLES
ncbi:MAG: aminopeptidase N [Gammaproteobacteria bacterium]|nr:MAG: aminopeptidase N [Gammaproteobacteria bacterium]RTZ75710.1 MAG: aminopeptidase N [Gammaproteobacteria bacterium]RTZ77929.1 MAG: aminopeptidase N [Gammaproteobacteria bacterium]